MSMDFDASADTLPELEPVPSPSPPPFEVLNSSRCGLEIRHKDGAIFAFTLNAAHTGLAECRRPYEGADHEINRAAARRFAQAYAHETGMIFCPSSALTER